MRARVLPAAAVAGVVLLGATAIGQQRGHLNPMIDLLIAKKAVIGLGVPTAGRGGGNVAAANPQRPRRCARRPTSRRTSSRIRKPTSSSRP